MLIFFFCFACVVLCIFIVAKNIYIHFCINIQFIFLPFWQTNGLQTETNYRLTGY